MRQISFECSFPLGPSLQPLPIFLFVKLMCQGQGEKASQQISLVWDVSYKRSFPVYFSPFDFAYGGFSLKKKKNHSCVVKFPFSFSISHSEIVNVFPLFSTTVFMCIWFVWVFPFLYLMHLVF